jgi:hypothetical protein
MYKHGEGTAQITTQGRRERKTNGMGRFGSAALWGRARRGLGAVRGRGNRLRGRWSFSPAGFRRAWPRGGRSDHGAGSCVPCSWALDCAVPGGHAQPLGRRHARARVERSRMACAGVYAVPARAGWGRVNVGAAMQGFGRALRQRVSGAEDAGSVGVCLPGANNVKSRTHLRQEARALSRSLERSLPLSLSLALSLLASSLALWACVFRGRKVTRQEASGMVAQMRMFRAIMDSGCRMPPPQSAVYALTS